MLAMKLLAVVAVAASALNLELGLRQHAKAVWGPQELELEQAPLMCERYMCKPANVTMNADACIHLANDTYYLVSCAGRNDTKTYCNPDLDENNDDNYCQTPQPQQNGTMWPGELCASNSSCVSGFCSPVNNTCIGVGNGEECSSSTDCNPGLFCTAGYCRPQQLAGQSCASDFDCQNSLGCNKTSLFFGTCTPYFSVPVGGYVSDCMEDATSYLCQTGTCTQTSFRGPGVCIKPIKALANQPQACSQNTDCMGSSGSGVDFTGTCECGLNPTGTAYCKPFLGDVAGKNFMYYWLQLASSNVTQACNTMRRFDYNCITSLPIKYGKQAISANLMYLYYPLLQGNDPCIKSTFNSYYWNLNNAGALSAALLLAAFY